MASVRSLTLPHYETYPVHVALFKDVTNAAFLRSQLLEANSDFDYAFLDASMILSSSHLLSATFIALHNYLTSRAKTRTPHSELVFRLSPNNNIGESYRKFGLTDTTTNLVAVKLSITADGKLAEGVSRESVAKHLGEVVQGTSLDLSEEGEELGQFADLPALRKLYKLAGDGGKKGQKGAVVNGDAAKDERKELESLILGIISLKGS